MKNLKPVIAAVWLIALSTCRMTGQDLSDLYTKVSPGVVVIQTEEEELIGQAETKMRVSVGGLGTGFMINDSTVMTAAHVVQTAEKVKVKFTDGEEIPAKIVSSFKNADVAALRLIWPKKNAVVLPWGDSDKVKVGQQIFIIGSPLGFENSLSSGYISGRQGTNRTSNPLIALEYLSTDAAINMGNSGGPMFNMKGEVIGIVSHILSQSGGFEGLGFAATSNVSQRLMKTNIMWYGIDSYILSGKMARIFNLPQPEGLLVQKVVFRSPLGIMGVQGGDIKANIEGEELLLGGDIILAIEGVRISRNEVQMDKLAEMMKNRSPEDPINITILRGGKQMELKKE